MGIPYTVIKSNFSDQEVYYPKLVQKKHMSEETLLSLMRKNTALETGDLKLALSRFKEVVLEALEMGYSVDTPLGRLALNLKGQLGREDQGFRPDLYPEHQVKLSYRSAKEIKDTLRHLRGFQKVEPRTITPYVQSVHPLKGEESSPPKAGDVLQIRGANLQPPAKTFGPQEGVYLQTLHGEWVKVPTILQVYPKSILFQLPQNAEPFQSLQVRIDHPSQGYLRSQHHPLPQTHPAALTV
jgi:hypothetical protein